MNPPGPAGHQLLRQVSAANIAAIPAPVSSPATIVSTRACVTRREPRTAR